MEVLPDSDTGGDEDGVDSPCLEEMGMDGVRGDGEPHLLEAAAAARI